MDRKAAAFMRKRDVLLPWGELPEFMRTPEVRPYWEILWKHKMQLKIKRAFDVIMSITLIMLMFIPMIVIALVIKLDSKGPVIYRQDRITQYGRKFKINKFRTMHDTESAVDKKRGQVGPSVTVANDDRITRVGKVLRKYRLDEFPQLFNVLNGDMSFVGTRPEVPKYVKCYKNLWNATLLLSSGITSECSIRFKDEYKLLENADNVDNVYVNIVLPEKMKINLKALRRFSISNDLFTMIGTVFAVAQNNL